MALELEELQREQAGYEQQIQAVDEAMKAIQEQIDSMACTVSQNKVFTFCVYSDGMKDFWISNQIIVKKKRSMYGGNIQPHCTEGH